MGILGNKDLLRYLPQIGIDRLAKGDIHAREPWQHRTEGALLFADIAGYVSLTEDLTRDGPKGSERVTDIVEEFFSRFTEIIEGCRGDVVSLAGDSIVAFWPDTGKLEDTLVVAAQCAMDLHALERRLAGEHGPVIRTRAAVSAGELVISGVGGTGGRMMTVLSGATVRESGLYFHDVKPGQTVVCPSAVGMLEPHCALEPLEPGSAILVRVETEPAKMTARHQVNQSADLEPVISEYLPEFLIRRVKVGAWQRFAEFRQTSVVFVNLPIVGDKLEELQPLVSSIQQLLHNHGGSLEQLAVDEKGLNALGAFGLPSHSHKDDALRALRAGLALDKALRERGIRSQMGIASGLLYCAEVGTPSRSHIAICGPSINLAARLAATGVGLLCDSSTAEAAGRNFTFSIVRELPITGLEGRFRVFRPEQETAPVTRRPRRSIVGRSAELDRIVLRLEQLELGVGGAAVVTGEPGIGKSSLLWQAVSIAEERGCRLLVLTPDDADPSPFGLWFGLREDSDGESQELRQPRGDDTAPGTVVPSTWAVRFKSGIVEHLTDLAQSPLVLAIDDLQRADDESLYLLGEVLEKVPGCLVLATAVPSGSDKVGRLSKLRSGQRADRLHLGALNRESIAEQASELLGVEAIPSSLQDHLYERTGGHPLFCEELVLAMQTSGRIVTTGGVCKVTKGRAMAVDAPPSLQAVVAMRVDNLDGRQQRLVKTASVLGRQFPAELLRATDNQTHDKSEFDNDIAMLESRDFLVSTSEMLRFKHPLMRDIIYTLLPDRERRLIHADALRSMQDQESVRDSDLAALTLHAQNAGDYPQAIGFLEQQVDLARKRYANREAIRLQQQAFELAEIHGVLLDGRKRADWWANMADAHQELSEHRLADSCYREALKAMDYLPPETKLGLASRAAGQLVQQLFRRLPTGKRRQPSADSARLIFLSHICQRMSEVAYFQNEPMTVLHFTLCAANLAEAAQAYRQEAIGQASLAIGLSLQGMGRMARHYSSLSLATAHAHGDDENRAYTHLLATVMAQGEGDWDMVKSNGDEACRLYSKIGDEIRLHQARFAQLFASLLAGDIDSAEAIHAEMNNSPSCMNYQQTRFWTVIAATLLDMLAGRSTEFRIQQMQELNVDSLDLSDRMLGYGITAVGLLNLGERRQALDAAEAGLSLLLQYPPTIGGGYVFGAAGPAEVLLHHASDSEVLSADRNAAKLRANEAIKALRIYAKRVPVARPRILLLEGRLAELSGNRRKALRLWREGVRMASGLGMKLDLELLNDALTNSSVSSVPSTSGTTISVLDRRAETGFEDQPSINDKAV